MEQILSLALGALSSYLQGNSGKENLTKRQRYFISMGASFLAGLIAVGFNIALKGEFSWEGLLSSIGLAFAGGQTYYNTYFKLKQ